MEIQLSFFDATASRNRLNVMLFVNTRPKSNTIVSRIISNICADSLSVAYFTFIPVSKSAGVTVR